MKRKDEKEEKLTCANCGKEFSRDEMSYCSIDGEWYCEDCYDEVWFDHCVDICSACGAWVDHCAGEHLSNMFMNGKDIYEIPEGVKEEEFFTHFLIGPPIINHEKLKFICTIDDFEKKYGEVEDREGWLCEECAEKARLMKNEE